MDAAMPRPTIEDKERKLSEVPDLVVGSGRSAAKYKTDLIPPALVVARYLGDKQAEVDDLTVAAEEATRAVEEYVEEQAVEDGLLADAMEDGKISKVTVSARLKDVKSSVTEREEIDALGHALLLYNREAAAKKAAKDTQAALDLATLKKYGDLTLPEIKKLVLDDKWQTTLVNRAAEEVTGLTLDLVARIQELGERYEATVAALDKELDELAAKTASHLADLGVR